MELTYTNARGIKPSAPFFLWYEPSSKGTTARARISYATKSPQVFVLISIALGKVDNTLAIICSIALLSTHLKFATQSRIFFSRSKI